MGALNEDSLKQLLPRCLQKDEAALEEFVRMSFPYVKTTVVKTLHEHSRRDEEVEDGVSDVFCTILGNLHHVAAARSPIGYLKTIIRNAARGKLSDVRELADHEESVSPMELRDDEENPGAGALAYRDAATLPDQGVRPMMQEVETMIRQALNGLKPDALRMLRLKYEDEYDYDTIAQILGSTAGALRISMHRLRKDVDERLSEDAALAVMDYPGWLGAVAHKLAPPADVAALDPATANLLEDYVADEPLGESDRKRAEEALKGSADWREYRALLERRLAASMDVEAHALNEAAPEDLVQRLVRFGVTGRME